jgi:hypothetical protein
VLTFRADLLREDSGAETSKPRGKTHIKSVAAPVALQSREIQNFLNHPNTMAHDLTVFSVTTVVRALTFIDELYSGMS